MGINYASYLIIMTYIRVRYQNTGIEDIRVYNIINYNIAHNKVNYFVVSILENFFRFIKELFSTFPEVLNKEENMNIIVKSNH